MTAYGTRRLSDGLISSVTDVPNPPSNLIQRAIDGDGGIFGDWEQLILSNVQVSEIEAANGGRAYLNNDAISIKSLVLSSNKSQITANGIDSAAITANTGDNSYTGQVKFTVTAPDGTIAIESVNAVAGVATTTLTTTQVANHVIRAECVEFGYKEIVVEGI